MIYTDSDLPKGSSSKPYIFTNFVSTVDGKVQILTNWKSYWPIGSKTDHDTLTQLRSLADCLIHGSKLANIFPFVESIHTEKLKSLRRKLGKSEILPYVVLSNHPNKNLIVKLESPDKTYLITSKNSYLPSGSDKLVKIVRIGEDEIDLIKLMSFLSINLGTKRILVEGGPTLLGSFLEENLIDEIFLTIAPKIFGNKTGDSLTLVEGRLFEANKIKNLGLISTKTAGDELYIRYRVKK